LEACQLQLGDTLEFNCVRNGCENTVRFAIFDISKKNYVVSCSECGNEYKFDKTLLQKLIKFEKLCRAVNEAEDILSDTNVSIDMAGHAVKIPFRLLLTRLNTQLDLDISGKQIQIKFRLLPLQSKIGNSPESKDAKAQSG